MSAHRFCHWEVSRGCPPAGSRLAHFKLNEVLTFLFIKLSLFGLNFASIKRFFYSANLQCVFFLIICVVFLFWYFSQLCAFICIHFKRVPVFTEILDTNVENLPDFDLILYWNMKLSKNSNAESKVGFECYFQILIPSSIPKRKLNHF